MDLLEHIFRAKQEAIAREIKTYDVIIDKDIAYKNFSGIGFQINDRYSSEIELPRMILGLKCEYKEGLQKEYGCNFIIQDKNIKEKTLADYTDEELLEELKIRLDARFEDEY